MMGRALFAVVLLLASPSAAQDCAEGRERVDGFCCWPGQSFSTEARRCEGAPRCPADLVEHGESCVARARSPQTVASSVVLPPPGASSSPPDDDWVVPSPYTAHFDWPATHAGQGPLHHAAIVRGEDEGLITFALSVFDFGFVLGMILGLSEALGSSCSPSGGGFGFARVNCQSWPLSFIPLVGGISAGFASFNGTRQNAIAGYVDGIPSVLLQTIGLVMAIVAFSNETTEMAFPRLEAGGLTASIVPGAPSTDAGLSLVVDL